MSCQIPFGSNVWVQWHDANGAMSRQFGRAAEIGQNGFVIMANSAPPRGTEVQLIIEMKGEGSCPSRLVGKGEVLRSFGTDGGPYSFYVKAFLQEAKNLTDALRLVRWYSQRSINKTTVGRNSSTSHADARCSITFNRVDNHKHFSHVNQKGVPT